MTLPGYNQPYWVRQAECAAFAPLEGDLDTDVVVIGAGITGLTAGLLLLQAGKRAAILEMNRVAGGTTGHSTGHVDRSYDSGFAGIIGKFGLDSARVAAEAKRAAVERIVSWNAELALDARLERVDAFQYAESAAQSAALDEEYDACSRLDLPVERVDSAPLPFATRGAILYRGQARMDPLRYACGLAAVFAARGGVIHEGTRVEGIEEHDGGVRVATDRGMATAECVVTAGHGPLLGGLSLAPRARAYQSYVICAHVREPVPDALYWDMAEPYHYTRCVGEPDTLIVGGADHHTGADMHTATSFTKLELYVRRHYQVNDFQCRWSHEYWRTADLLPYIGRVPGFKNVYIGMGYSGDGLTLGTAAGTLMSDLALGRDNPAAAVFSPSRIKAAASAERLASNILHLARHRVGDRLSGGDVESLDDVQLDEGRLVVVGVDRLAVYRDKDGAFHALSSVCTHQGCVVHWNDAEKTWDCPCHGSRYDAGGRVIMGPAKRPLEVKVIKR